MAWLLALALVAAQALGLAHRIAHGPLPAVPVPQALQVPQTDLARVARAASQAHTAHMAHMAHTPPAAQHPGELQERHGLFHDHESGGVECRLFDQASQADGLVADALPALPPRPPAHAPAAARARRATGAACAYLARGPPALASTGLHAA